MSSLPLPPSSHDRRLPFWLNHFCKIFLFNSYLPFKFVHSLQTSPSYQMSLDTFVGRDPHVDHSVSYHKLRDALGNFRELVCVTQAGDKPFDAAPPMAVRVTHGTPLSIAHTIMRSSFRAGGATHQGMTGVFCIGDSLLAGEGFSHARDRAKCNRCTEWIAHREPSSWSLPVVLAFYPLEDTVTHLETIGASLKCVIRCSPGTYLPRGRIDMWYDLDEARAWVHLHLAWYTISCLFTNQEAVMCGGTQHDALFWSRDTNNMPASCARVCCIADMKAHGWRRTKNVSSAERIYRCPHCVEPHLHVV